MKMEESRSLTTDFFTYKGDKVVYIFPPLKIAEATIRYAVQNDLKFVAIFHVHGVWPAWASELKLQERECLKLDKTFLIQNRLDTSMETCSLIPAKKRDEKWGYYKEPKAKTLYALYHI